MNEHVQATSGECNETSMIPSIDMQYNKYDKCAYIYLHMYIDICLFDSVFTLLSAYTYYICHIHIYIYNNIIYVYDIYP